MQIELFPHSHTTDQDAPEKVVRRKRSCMYVSLDYLKVIYIATSFTGCYLVFVILIRHPVIVFSK
jgi:hypothetical protein